MPIFGSFGALSQRALRGLIPITYSISPNVSSVNEGSSVTFNITTTNFGSGTLYWTLEATQGTINNSDFSSPSSAFTAGAAVTITNNSGSFSVTLANDLSTEGTEKFRANLRTGSTSGSIVATSSDVTINDTSVTPSFNPGFGPAFNPGFGPSFNPGFGPSFNPGFAPGFNPGFAPGFNPGFAPLFFGPPTFKSVGVSTLIRTTNGLVKAEDLEVGDTLISADISGFPYQSAEGVTQAALSWTDENPNINLVETQIVYIDRKQSDYAVVINLDIFSAYHYILIKRDGIAKFVISTDVVETDLIYTYEILDWEPIITLEKIPVEHEIVSINCEPYDMFFTENMLTHDSSAI